MTEQQAQNRLATLCAKGEHCTQEMLEKLRKWEIDDEAQARIMDISQPITLWMMLAFVRRLSKTR